MKMFSFKYRNVILGVTATAVGYYAVLLPHTVFLTKYRVMTAVYQMGNEIPLGFKIRKRIQEVMDDLKLSDDVRQAIKPFSSFSFDMFHAGTLNAKYGAILGFPSNFTRTKEELRENLQINQEPLDCTRQDSQFLLEAIMYSEDAKKFAIAREILRIRAQEPYFNSLVLALIVATLWTLYNVVSYRYKLREGNAMVRRIFYTILTLFGAILWFGVKDYRSNQLDRDIDEALCHLGAKYVKGGHEFYEKMLIRNKALRSLLGNQGKSLFTAYGNEEIFLRQKHVPITQRKDFFVEQLRNLEGTK